MYSDHVESKNNNSIFGKSFTHVNNRDTLQRFGGGGASEEFFKSEEMELSKQSPMKVSKCISLHVCKISLIDECFINPESQTYQ